MIRGIVKLTNLFRSHEVGGEVRGPEPAKGEGDRGVEGHHVHAQERGRRGPGRGGRCQRSSRT